jgi:hypothetical protein
VQWELPDKFFDGRASTRYCWEIHEDGTASYSVDADGWIVEHDTRKGRKPQSGFVPQEFRWQADGEQITLWLQHRDAAGRLEDLRSLFGPDQGQPIRAFGLLRKDGTLVIQNAEGQSFNTDHPSEFKKVPLPPTRQK